MRQTGFNLDKDHGIIEDCASGGKLMTPEATGDVETTAHTLGSKAVRLAA